MNEVLTRMRNSPDIRLDSRGPSYYDEILSRASVLTNPAPHCCSVCKSSVCRLRSHRDYVQGMTMQLVRRQLVQSRVQHGPSYGIHNERVNPLASLPIAMTRQLEILYNQLFSRWNYEFNGPERHLFPFSRYSAILNAAPDDKALLIGLLSLVATQISIARHGTVDEFALRLQLQVIKAQQQAVQRDGRATDARIATAQCILGNSVHSDQNEDVGSNLAVIKHMAHQRGGITKLGMDGVLADNFMYIDHLSAIVRNVLPEFILPQPYSSSAHAPKSRAVYQDLHRSDLLSDQSVRAATLFDVLLQIYDNEAKGLHQPSNANYFAYLASAVECELAIANAKHHDTKTLDECLTLGLLIFNHTVFRNSRRVAPPVLLFERRFWACFHSLRERKFFLHHDLVDLECYLACIGTITSLRHPSSATKQTIQVLVELRAMETSRVPDFDALCRVMEKYGWSRTVCFNLYQRIWDESCSHSLGERGHGILERDDLL